eukprot:s2_g25.t1
MAQYETSKLFPPRLACDIIAQPPFARKNTALFVSKIPRRSLRFGEAGERQYIQLFESSHPARTELEFWTSEPCPNEKVLDLGCMDAFFGIKWMAWK